MAPQKPALTTTAGNASATLRWAGIAGVDGWEYQQNGAAWTAVPSSSDATSYAVTGLTSGVSYTFKVRAYIGADDARLNCVESGAASATPTSGGSGGGGGGVTPPPVIFDLVPAFGNNATIADQELTQGALYTSATALPTATDGDGTITYSVGDLPTGLALDSERRLTSRVTAPLAKTEFAYTATDGDTAEPDSASLTFTISVAPQQPEDFTATAGDTRVTLSWAAIAGVIGWEIKQDSGDWTAISGSDAATNSHTVTGLTNGTAYTFRVRAFVGTGDTLVEGVESDAKSALPLAPATPTTTPAPTPTTTPTPDPVPPEPEEGGLSPWWLALLPVLPGAGGIGYYFYCRSQL